MFKSENAIKSRDDTIHRVMNGIIHSKVDMTFQHVMVLAYAQCVVGRMCKTLTWRAGVTKYEALCVQAVH